jgi:hypothetical protein
MCRAGDDATKVYGPLYIVSVSVGAIMIFGSLAVIHYYKVKGIIPVELPYIDRTTYPLESSRSHRSTASAAPQPEDHVSYLEAARSRMFKAVQSSRQKRQVEVEGGREGGRAEVNAPNVDARVPSVAFRGASTHL